jgi:hydrogenase-4 component F
MIIASLILVPAVAGLVAMFWRSRGGRRALLVATAMAHAALTTAVWTQPQEPILNGWLGIDSLGLIFLTLVSVLFLASAVYSLGYLRNQQHTKHVDAEEGFLFTNEPEAILIGCLLLFLAAMTLVTACQHLGLLWVGVEATTLASAPLIYFHRHHRSLEATWKYIMLCSVGIALALLGNFLLAVAASGTGDGHSGLLVTDLMHNASGMHTQWLKAAFLFFLVGYGTKMGLAPMHTWLPDAHSESPSLVSALLSGALLNCAFLGILRAHALCVAAGEAEFSQGLLVVFGLLSMGIATVFILRQADFKRMLAYSSVEHMGILALGIGIGGAGVFGSLLHACNHSLTKAALFFAAGNILTVYRTKSIADVRGVLSVLPVTGVLWIAGFLSITGSPPFGTFLSEFTILKAALDGGQILVAVLYLVFLSLIFIGMVNIVLRMAQGEQPAEQTTSPRRESWLEIMPPAVLVVLVLALGVYIPPQLNNTLQMAAEQLGSGAKTELAVTEDSPIERLRDFRSTPPAGSANLHRAIAIRD